ncbi:MAG: FAD-dependent oxidoreductase, partial [Aestuariivirgaceae bacterium]
MAALVASGELRLRIDKDGGFRGPFCGMGVCQECLVDVDGASAERACMIKVDRAMTVRRQASRVAIDGKVTDRPADQPFLQLPALTPQIAVIGGGPGGMAEATNAARSGADVLLIDERPQLGGQFYKQPLAASDLQLADFDDQQFLGGRRLIGELEGSGARLMHSARVVGAYEPLDLVVGVENETRLVRPQILIVATGAYEISYPFDGWTLPGVMTTGAAQTLLRSYRVLPGQRVLVAGNGPLNFQVAAELARSGADVVAVVEAAARPGLYDLNTIARMMTADARLALKGAGYLSTLGRRGVPLLFGHRISRVSALDGGNRPRLLAVIDGLSGDNSQTREFEADAVCLGYGFRPSNDILRALGCEHTVNPHTGALETVRDKDCRTSRNNVLAVGDCTR